MNNDNSAVIRPRIHSANKQPLQNLVPLKTPISVHIDVSSVCNYKCSFCFQADTVGMNDAGLKRGLMSSAMFKKVVDELDVFPDKIKKIKIGNHGEPTLNPNLVEMIEYARKSNRAEIIEMFTNGSKLEPILNNGIVKAGLQRINISLEGLSDERYFQVAGIKQNFEQIIQGVKNLYQIKTELNSDLKIYVKIADQAHALKKDSTEIYILSEEEKKFFLETFSPICDEIFIEKIVPQWAETQLEKQNEITETGMYGQAINSWKEVCPFIFMYLQINCDGTISPCTLDWPRKVVIGNVNNQTIGDVWSGESLRNLQVAMLAGKRNCINFCNACSAPMVCVEENLDLHCEEIISAIGGEKNYASLENNSWINSIK
jgi:radical SAM protein with 4Fe4S-binding SPASM domain